MNSKIGSNIVNAVSVVYKTYESINKLMLACQDIADGRQVHYEMVTDAKHFLRYRSDRDIYGWLYSSFILLYQHTDKDKYGNSLFVMDINLEEHWGDGQSPNSWRWWEDKDRADDVAVIALAKFDYDDIDMLENALEKISPADFWKFYQPLYELDDSMEETTENNIFKRVVKKGIFLDKHLRVRRVSLTTVPLVDVDGNNLKEKIFGTFDQL